MRDYGRLVGIPWFRWLAVLHSGCRLKLKTLGSVFFGAADMDDSALEKAGNR